MAAPSIVIKLGVDAATLTQGFARAQSEVQRGVKQLQGALGALGGAFAGLSVANFGKDAFNVFAGFQQQMQELKAVSGATQAELQSLEKNARDLGASTRYAASEVAGLQVEYSKLGFAPAEIQAATGATLALAQATGAELVQSAEIAGATVRAFGLEAAETARVQAAHGEITADEVARALEVAEHGDKRPVSRRIVDEIGRVNGVTIKQRRSAGLQGRLPEILAVVILHLAQRRANLAGDKVGCTGCGDARNFVLKINEIIDGVGEITARIDAGDVGNQTSRHKAIVSAVPVRSKETVQLQCGGKALREVVHDETFGIRQAVFEQFLSDLHEGAEIEDADGLLVKSGIIFGISSAFGPRDRDSATRLNRELGSAADQSHVGEPIERGFAGDEANQLIPKGGRDQFLAFGVDDARQTTSQLASFGGVAGGKIFAKSGAVFIGGEHVGLFTAVAADLFGVLLVGFGGFIKGAKLGLERDNFKINVVNFLRQLVMLDGLLGAEATFLLDRLLGERLKLGDKSASLLAQGLQFSADVVFIHGRIFPPHGRIASGANSNSLNSSL